jgi:hypothetical protein
MVVELIGFVAGAAVLCAAALALVRHEQWRAIASAYGSAGARRRPGNALIWPSR